MRATHIEFLVEEPSIEAFLQAVLPKILEGRTTFSIHAHQGKMDLLQKLTRKLKAYSKWLPEDYRIIVLVDRDDDDCFELKMKMEHAASAANLLTRSADAAHWNVANRIVIEELEAWFFGAWKAVRDTYPRVPATIPKQSHYRDSDAICGGTWEAFERILQRAGYFTGGLRKVEAAKAIGLRFDAKSCKSTSFCHFKEIISEVIKL